MGGGGVTQHMVVGLHVPSACLLGVFRNFCIDDGFPLEINFVNWVYFDRNVLTSTHFGRNCFVYKLKENLYTDGWYIYAKKGIETNTSAYIFFLKWPTPSLP